MKEARFWGTPGAREYDAYTALVYERHADVPRRPGCWTVGYTGGVEAWDFIGRPPQVAAVTDDFGNLVRVTS